MNRREFLCASFASICCAATPSVVRAAEDVAGGDGLDAMFRADRAISVKPYVQLLSDHTVGVAWMTAKRATGYVEWTQDGVAWQRVWMQKDGLRDANTRIHRAIIDGFNPTKLLRFRVVSRPFSSFGPYSVSYAGEAVSEEGSILPLRPTANGSFSLLMFNDVHRVLKLFPTLLAQMKTPAQAVVFNGDILSDVLDEGDVQKHLLAPLALMTNRGMPTYYLRGNHETRGPYARQLRDYLNLPNDHYYGAVTMNRARLVFLDSGEDKFDTSPEYNGLVEFDSYIAEQARWLKAELASPAWRKATWRVVFMHIPPLEKKSTGAYPPRLDQFYKLMAKARVSAFFSAHTHVFHAYPPSQQFPYPMIVGGGPKAGESVVTRIDFAPRTMTVTQTTPEGKVVTEETIPIA